MANKSRQLDPYEQPNVWDDVQPAAFPFAEEEESLETEELPENCLVYGHTPRIKTINAMKRRWAVREIGRLPDPGESINIISNARFDFWDWVPAIIEMAAPRVVSQWYGSTWILNRRNATELLALHDAGKIQAIGMITGIYFKRRESAVFATLYEGLKSRGQRFKAALNHSKWFSLELDDETCLTVEASANFTENGNIEQYVYTNDPGLFQFYKSFADEILKHGGDTAPSGC